MTVFNYETLNALGARLIDNTDSIVNVASHEMELDIRLAARVCSKLASLRFRVAEIAETALTQAPSACSSAAASRTARITLS